MLKGTVSDGEKAGPRASHATAETMASTTRDSFVSTISDVDDHPDHPYDGNKAGGGISLPSPKKTIFVVPVDKSTPPFLDWAESSKNGMQESGWVRVLSMSFFCLFFLRLPLEYHTYHCFFISHFLFFPRTETFQSYEDKFYGRRCQSKGWHRG